MERAAPDCIHINFIELYYKWYTWSDDNSWTINHIENILEWRAFFKNPFVDCDEGVEAGEDDIEPNTLQVAKVWITFTTTEMRSMSKTHSSISRRYVLIIIPQLWCNTHWVCSCRVAYGRLGWATSWVALSDAAIMRRTMWLCRLIGMCVTCD